MRIVAVVALMVLWSSAAVAQTPAMPAAEPPGAEPPNSTLPPASAGISRDDYIAKARDAAAKRAGTRFDAMDADHDGILTKDEIVAYRAAHARKKTTATPQ